MERRLLQVLATFLLVYFVTLTSITSAATKVDIAPSKSITKQEVRYAVNAVSRITKYMREKHGEVLTNNVRIYLHRTGDKVSSNFGGSVDSGEEGGQAVLGQINVNLPMGADEYYITFIIAHEMTHQYQMLDTGVSTLNRNLWFVEGMADVIGTRVANEVNPGMYDKFVNNAFVQTARHPIGLYVITTRDGWKNNYERGAKTYAKADLALIYLTTRFPDSYMFKYMFALSVSSPEEALKSVYGIESIADLEVELEGLRDMRKNR